MTRASPVPDSDAADAERDVEALLVSPALRDVVPAALLADFHDVLDYVVLDPGMQLLHQGDTGEDLYVVLHGRLAVELERSDGTAGLIDEIGPGGVVGEMALLTGQPRSATVVALRRTTALRISRVAFEHIAAADPEAMHGFMRRVLHRLRRSQVVRLMTELFGALDEQAVRDIEARMEWVHVPSGARLFAERDAGEDVFLVVNGRLRVTATDEDGSERVLEEVGRGGVVGEVALLTGEPRSASVHAIRDSHLLRLTRSAFDELLDRHPRAMMQVARAAVSRLHRTALHVPRKARASSFMLLGLTPQVPIGALARRLTAMLREQESVAHFGSAEVDRALNNPGVSRAAEGTVVNEALTAWLSAQEREHGALVLEADPQWNAWTRRCVLQADRILLVASAHDAPEPTAIERELHRLAITGRTELVLLHPEDTVRPSGTLAWLAPRTVAAHHHVRLGRDEDVRRLARRIGGRAVGLVLGGGGARGFAHIGALRAFAEAGVSLDILGGTSIGALIAGGVAAGLTVEDLRRLAETFASPRKLLDRTLPVAALMAGAKVTALYRQVFGDLAIEDLWIPYFGMSSGLSRAIPFVHQRGPLWQAVRASTAIPAIFPPLLGEDDEVHVDGGVMNNMPLDVMRGQYEAGTVIGVNPMVPHDRPRAYHFGPSLSGWQALMGRLKFLSRVRAPSILGSVMRATEINSAHRMRQPSFRALADLLIEPPVGDFPILAFDRHREIIEIGYRSAREGIAGWQSAPQIDPPRDAAAAA